MPFTGKDKIVANTIPAHCSCVLSHVITLVNPHLSVKLCFSSTTEIP